MNRKRTSVDNRDWPATDRDLWLRAISDGGYFAAAGAAAHWADATKIQVAKGYAKWLGFLTATGQLDALESPVYRANMDRLIGYVAWLEGQSLASTTITSRVRDLREALRVMAPEADLSRLSGLVSRLAAREVPRRDKRARVMHPTEILTTALAYLKTVPDRACINHRVRAGWYRDGVIIAFLAVRPIRLRNLAQLTIGETIVRDDDGWHCRFDATQTKERRPLDFQLPAALNLCIDTYMQTYRPDLLSGGRDNALWISIRGSKMSGHGIYGCVCKLTERLFGHPINPHLFRDCAATAILLEDPAHALAAARILGHGSIDTTLGHYDQAEMVAASKMHCEAMLALKQQETRL